MNDADRDAEYRERRGRLGFNALVVGGVAFVVTMLCSGVNGGSEATNTLSLTSFLSLAGMVVVPVAMAVAAANLTSSDSTGLRFFYAVAAAVLALVLLMVVSFQVWTSTGGRFRM